MILMAIHHSRSSHCASHVDLVRGFNWSHSRHLAGSTAVRLERTRLGWMARWLRQRVMQLRGNFSSLGPVPAGSRHHTYFAPRTAVGVFSAR
jgi:hypothetical protein